MAKSAKVYLDIFARATNAISRLILQFRWPLALGYLAAAFGAALYTSSAHGD